LKSVEYTATIKTSEIGKGGAYISFPFDVKEVFGKTGRIKVKCMFENIEYRGSLVKMGMTSYIIGISKDIRSKLGKDIGHKIHVSICEDTDERIVEIHPELQPILDTNPEMLTRYNKLSHSKRKEIWLQLSSAKRPETLKSRLKQIVDEM